MFVEDSMLVILPSFELGLTDAPTSNLELTQALKVPVVNMNLTKYLAIQGGRGDREMNRSQGTAQHSVS